jgi:hypothetical protein
MSRSWLVLTVLLALAWPVRPAHAQIVNVQDALAKPLPFEGQAGQLEGKLTWREGNNPIFDIGGSGNILIRRGDFLALALVRGEYGTSAGVLLTKKTFEHVRLRYKLDGPWMWEAFAQAELDQFRRLNLRAITGAGIGVQLLDTKPIGILAAVAYMYEDERLDDRAGTIDAGVQSTAHRISAYITGHENLSTGATIVETVYAQPRIDDPGDFRIYGELSLQSKLTSRIALKDSINIAYDATPPDGVKTYDTSVEASLIFSF